jgi:hypothetical protein
LEHQSSAALSRALCLNGEGIERTVIKPAVGCTTMASTGFCVFPRQMGLDSMAQGTLPKRLRYKQRIVPFMVY